MRGIEVDVIGAGSLPEAPSRGEMQRLCAVAASAAGVQNGHVAIEFVDAMRIAALNAEHRGKSGPTDVLSFPIDGAQPTLLGSPLAPPPPRELGDVVICPEHTEDIREAVVHGVLHLVGMDHETDAGEMLALQAEILRWEVIDPQNDAADGAGDPGRARDSGLGTSGKATPA
ncbi:MAG TPA: rRNA maturation RNase YbeY [Solirubrobacteraceae bacterium]|jgi:probable rRNA maturation factor